MPLLVRYDAGDGPRLGLLENEQVRAAGVGSLAEALALPAAALRARIDSGSVAQPLDSVQLLAPVDVQEVWAAGVTYERSREARVEESHGLDLYAKVYGADRPELFFKASGPRVVGPGGTVAVRADSGWDLPEPEIVVVLNSRAEIIGYTVGNDVSSRAIEGENALYLPQAKVYTNSCAIGPAILPAWEAGAEPVFEIELTIRRGDAEVFRGSVSTAQMRRGFGDLSSWLFRAMEFPHGVLLMTGTGIVPGSELTLSPGDAVDIDVPRIGRLSNQVELAGAC